MRRPAPARETTATSTASDVDDLRRQVSGPVHEGGNAQGLAELAGPATTVDQAPIAIVGARDAADVGATVRWAGRRGLAVAVHATGHAARSYRDVVVVTTTRMNQCLVDAERRTATVGAGVRWETVIAAAATCGLAPLNGSSSSVGVVGYTVGGGVGALARQYGFAADHVRSLELVTAEGRLVHVNALSHPDLYWAVLGAPGSFGVVTRIEFDLMPVRRLYAGALYFDAEQASAVFQAFRAWSAGLPDATTSSIALLTQPPGPAALALAPGRAVVHLRFAHLGDSETGAEVISAMRGAGRVLLDTLRDTSYADVATTFNDPRDRAPSFSTGAFLDSLDARAVDALLDVAGPQRHLPMPMIELRHLGGALGRLPARPNCVGGRDAAYALGLVAAAPPQLADAAPALCAQVLDAMGPWTADDAPVNYLSGTSDRLRQLPWSQGDRARLRQLKRSLDPGNTFRVGPTVQP
jgi:FAD/FMN-containing dehydrogenase